MNKNSIIIIVIVAVIVGAASFFGGITYQKTQRPQFEQFMTRSGNMRMGNGQGRNFLQGGRPISGEIVDADDKTITVKLQDGSTKIVIISDKTAINKASEGSVSDLKKGEKVAAFGTENSDGSVTAQNIQLNPLMRFMTGPTPSK